MKTEDKILIGANPAALPVEHSISLTFAVKDKWWRRDSIKRQELDQSPRQTSIEFAHIGFGF